MKSVVIVVFLFVFIFSMFSPLAINVGGNIKTDKSKKEVENKKSIPKTVKDIRIEDISGWHTARASYYDSKDSSQTREDCNGVGALGRRVKSGSIALGSSFTDELKKEGVVVFVQVKNLNVITPYGKAIFRVDDLMAERFNKKGFHIDFFYEDLDSKHKLLGRFKVKFRIYKIAKTTTDLYS